MVAYDGKTSGVLPNNMYNARIPRPRLPEFTCLVIPPDRAVPGLVEDVREGLLQPPRSLPPKYFYDAKGSWLFEQICRTPEYYLTRNEDALLAEHGRSIIAEARPDQILEFGSGNSHKTRRLFDACEQTATRCSYAPFDVCASMLEAASETLQSDYRWLEITPMQGDYHAGLGRLPPASGRRLAVFLGSTIGNFTPGDALGFLREIRSRLKPGDYLLLGVDRIKDKCVIDAAYNDGRGITAAFNLNLLRVLNRELATDFNLGCFRHQAEFKESQERVEMHLVCSRDQRVHLRRMRETIAFRKGDEILTELSYKYTWDKAEKLLEDAGFAVARHCQPTNGYFSLLLGRCN